MSEPTRILSFRSSDTNPGTVIADPRAYKVDPDQPNLRLAWNDVETDVAGKHVLFVVHGFNVPGSSGKLSAAAMEEDLRTDPAASYLFSAADVVVGVLWPGDWNVSIVNYSWEYADGDNTGLYLARAIERRFRRATSISMVSHSLGARVVLTAAAQLNGAMQDKLREVCVTAPAVDDDCLNRQFAGAVENARRIVVLASRRDVTLAAAYPAGDLLSDAMGDTDNPFGGALGRYGPKAPVPANVESLTIPERPHNALLAKPQPLSDFDHTDYFPKSKRPRPKAPRKSDAVSRFIGNVFNGQRLTWR